MARGTKYEALTNYLKTCGRDRVTMTFDQISRLGAELPPSAYKYPALWSNGYGSLSFGWLNAGYVATVRLTQQVVEFVENRGEASRYLEAAGSQGIEEPSVSIGHGDDPSTFADHVDVGYYASRALSYYSDLANDENARYRSWEHCYSFFAANHRAPDEQTLDWMCLHLAWYLASWGMLRGGAFLLQKDYKVHLPVVRLLTGDRAANLYRLSIQELCRGEKVDEIMELSEEIVAAYRQKTKREDLDGGQTASETLVTKILLGTIGCAPAYDRYFKQALRASGVAAGNFSKRSILQLAEFYRAHLGDFENCRAAISANGLEYPPMKVLDMCFWQVGFDADNGDQELGIV